MEYWLYKILKKISNKTPSFLSCIITGIIFIIIGIFGLFFGGIKILCVIAIILGISMIVINIIDKYKKD